MSAADEEQVHSCSNPKMVFMVAGLLFLGVEFGIWGLRNRMSVHGVSRSLGDRELFSRSCRNVVGRIISTISEEGGSEYLEASFNDQMLIALIKTSHSKALRHKGLATSPQTTTPIIIGIRHLCPHPHAHNQCPFSPHPTSSAS